MISKFRQRRLSESKGVAGKKGADKMNEKLPTIKGFCKDCYYFEPSCKICEAWGAHTEPEYYCSHCEPMKEAKK
jgi:hypothetical protein